MSTTISPPLESPLLPQRLPQALAALACVLLTACAVPATPAAATSPAGVVQMPLLHGWYEGLEVLYITTDVSDAAVAKDKGGNFAPRLASALALPPGKTSSVDKVYGVTNFDQGSVFASAPSPVGYTSRESAYSPLWRLVKVTWKSGMTKRLLTSEEAVLDAAEKGWVMLSVTDVVLNCPIVHRGGLGGLRGVRIEGLN